MSIPKEQTARLHEAIINAGVAITGVDLDGIVTPSNLQAAAQPTIDAFDQSQAAQDTWVLRKQTRPIGSSYGTRKNADQSTTLATLVDVDGMEFELDANSNYTFRFTGGYTASATTIGLQLSITGPASPAFFRAVCQISESVTAVRNGGIGAYGALIAGIASGGAAPLPFWIEGNITTGLTAGKIKLQFRSETAGNAVTILRGSQGVLFGIN